MPAASNPPTKLCDNCGEAYLPKHRRQRFCSKKCHWTVKNHRKMVDYPEHVRQQNRESYAKFRDKRRAEMRQRHAENRESRNEKTRAAYQYANSEHPYRYAIREASRRASRKGLAFDLSIEWAQARWTGRCEITDIPFHFATDRRYGPSMFSPSLDRIVPSLGYIQSNCRFILQAVNMLKSDGSDEDMFAIAEAIVTAKRIHHQAPPPKPDI